MLPHGSSGKRTTEALEEEVVRDPVADPGIREVEVVGPAGREARRDQAREEVPERRDRVGHALLEAEDRVGHEGAAVRSVFGRGFHGHGFHSVEPAPPGPSQEAR